MKKYILPAMAAALLLSGWQTAAALPAAGAGVYYADDSNADSAKPKKDKDKKKAATVGAAVKDLEFFNAKPSTKAKFYIYLQSASWCGPCNREMPDMVKQYEAMQKAGNVELILVSCDQTQAAAEGFLKKYNAPFPAIMPNAGGSSLPGIKKASGIPHATIVDAKGKVLYDGHASAVASGEWKKYTSPAKAKKGKKK